MTNDSRLTQSAEYERHVTTVNHFPGYDECRPECKCGWVGSYWTIDDNAYAEASRHVRETTHIDSSGAQS